VVDMKCERRGKEFEAKRKTAKYCGDKCRVAAGRLSVTDKAAVSVTPLSATSEVSVTVDVPRVQTAPVSPGQLEESGLKANRASMPGDYDYKGSVDTANRPDKGPSEPIQAETRVKG